MVTEFRKVFVEELNKGGYQVVDKADENTLHVSPALAPAAAIAAKLARAFHPLRFQRWGKSANQELQNGVIEFSTLEIARLDNDPNFPENGQLSLVLKGGL